MNRTLRFITTALAFALPAALGAPGRRDRRRGRPRHRCLGRPARRRAGDGDAHRHRRGARDDDRRGRPLRAGEPRARRVPRRRSRPPASRRRRSTTWSVEVGPSRAGGRRSRRRRARRGGRPCEERVVPVATGNSLVGRCRLVGGRREPAAQRPQLPGAGLPASGQRPGAQLRSRPSRTPVALSSAGQLGRGGNITIDGQDNNDDVVGGPLANLPQDAVQEFQIATNRFSAEQGRSAASAVNVVTRSGNDTFSGTATFLYRDDALQGLPATFDRSSGAAPPFSREQYSATLGGPIVRGKAWWFAAAEYRNQDAVVQVGRARHRDAHDPPGPGAGAARRLPRPGAGRRARVGQRHARPALRGGRTRSDIAASTLDRSIGSASQRQASDNQHHQGLVTWTRILGATASVNTLRASYSDFATRSSP